VVEGYTLREDDGCPTGPGRNIGLGARRRSSLFRCLALGTGGHIQALWSDCSSSFIHPSTPATVVFFQLPRLWCGLSSSKSFGLQRGLSFRSPSARASVVINQVIWSPAEFVVQKP